MIYNEILSIEYDIKKLAPQKLLQGGWKLRNSEKIVRRI